MVERAEQVEGEDSAPLVTIREAANMMRVSKMTVYRLVHAGTLPAVRIRRSYRIRRHDLDTYLRCGTVEGEEDSA